MKEWGPVGGVHRKILYVDLQCQQQFNQFITHDLVQLGTKTSNTLFRKVCRYLVIWHWSKLAKQAHYEIVHCQIYIQNFLAHATYGTQFFCFHIHYHLKAPASEVHAPKAGLRPLYGKSWIRPCIVY